MNTNHFCSSCNLHLISENFKYLLCENCKSEYFIENDCIVLHKCSNQFIEEYELKFTYHTINVKRYLKTIIIEYNLEQRLYFELLNFIDSINIKREQYLLNMIYQVSYKNLHEQYYSKILYFNKNVFFSDEISFKRDLKEKLIEHTRLSERWFKTSIYEIDPSNYKNDSLFF